MVAGALIMKRSPEVAGLPMVRPSTILKLLTILVRSNASKKKPENLVRSIPFLKEVAVRWLSGRFLKEVG